MTAAGVAQYLLFIRNANKDYLLLVLQSLALQFVLSPDQRLMTAPWTAWTRGRLETLMKHQENKIITLKEYEEVEGGTIEGKDPLDIIVENDKILNKVKLLFKAESIFLGCVSTVGILWTNALGYCM